MAPRVQLVFGMVVLALRAIVPTEAVVSKMHCSVADHAYEKRQGCGSNDIAIVSGHGECERHLIDNDRGKGGPGGIKAQEQRLILMLRAANPAGLGTRLSKCA